FECTGCGHHFERLQRLSDADPSRCPECESNQVRRQLTAPSFRLAGAGWYETDFKKDGKRNLADKGDAPKSEGAKSEGGKSEGSKTEGAKSEGTKSETAKPESKPAATPPKPAAPKTSE
ncbi:MAG: zinc ribbon domain-containing protein, partial [Arenimonas sp.]